MNKRTILTFTFSLFMIGSLFAQFSDQVKLHNGTTIRGNIVKIIPNGNVTIDDNAGNTWVFAMTDVYSIEEVEIEKASFNTDFEPQIVNMTSIGFLAGSQNSSYIAPFSLLTSFGFRNKSGLYTGLATGLEFLNVNHVPLMLDLQYFLRNQEVSPVLIFRAGYTLPTKWTRDYYSTNTRFSGGVLGAVGVGLKIRTKERFAWDVNVLYRYMQVNYTETYEWQSFDNVYKDVYNRLELRLGFYLN